LNGGDVPYAPWTPLRFLSRHQRCRSFNAQPFTLTSAVNVCEESLGFGLNPQWAPLKNSTMNISMPSPRQASARHASWLSIFAVPISVLLMVRQELHCDQVFDNSAHVACGMEWLKLSMYNY
jgi:hypothetical protein